MALFWSVTVADIFGLLYDTLFRNTRLAPDQRIEMI